MIIRRPLIWILGGWILGEIVAGWLGMSIIRSTSLDAVMEEQGTLSVTAVTGTVIQVTETAYGYQAVLTDNQVLWNEQILETNDLILREDSGEGSSCLSFLRPGNRIQITGSIGSFTLPGGPWEFDQTEYYRAKGIDYIVEMETCQVLDDVNGK